MVIPPKDLNTRKYKAASVSLNLCWQNKIYSALKKSFGGNIRKKQALVKWLVYSDDFNSWIPLSSFQELSN